MKQKWSEKQQIDSSSNHRSAFQLSALKQEFATLNILDSSKSDEQFTIFPKGRFNLSKDGFEGEADLILVSRKQENKRQLEATQKQNTKQQVAQQEVAQTKYQLKEQLTSKWKFGKSLWYWLSIAILLVAFVWLLRKKIKSFLT